MTTELPWVDVEVCTLPTEVRPLRLTEFDDVFTRLVEVTGLTPTYAVLHLADAPGLANLVTDLAARESACCSFFDFRVDNTDGLTLRIGVPPAHANVLAALVDRARAIAARGTAR